MAEDGTEQSQSLAVFPESSEKPQTPLNRYLIAHETNQSVKELLPEVAEALKRIFTIAPHVDINFDTLDYQERGELNSRPKFYLTKRAADAQKLLDLDFPVPADGSFGEHGERLLFTFVYHCIKSGMYSRALNRIERSNQRKAEMTGQYNPGIAGLSDYLETGADNLVEFGLKEKVATKNSGLVTLDVLLEQLDPAFYLEYRRARFVGGPEAMARLEEKTHAQLAARNEV